MIDLKMILQFGDGRTHSHTLVVVKSLPRLKIVYRNSYTNSTNYCTRAQD